MNILKGCVTNTLFCIVKKIWIRYTSYCYKCNIKTQEYPEKIAGGLLMNLSHAATRTAYGVAIDGVLKYAENWKTSADTLWKSSARG